MNWRISACVATATFLLGGCGSLLAPQPPPPPQLGSEPEPPQPVGRWLGTHFEDLPVPAEFTLDYQASYVGTSASGPRVADLRYTGEFGVTKFLQFIQPAMLKAGWRLESLTGAAIKTLRFVKGVEECEMVIHSGDGANDVLMVRLYPRAGA